MQKTALKLVLACGVTAATCFAQNIEVAAEATVPKEFTGKSGEKFLYRWREPAVKEAGKKYPLVVLLHGAGERGADNKKQLVWGATPIVEYFKKNNEEFFLVAGQVPLNRGWVEVPWGSLDHRMPKQPSKTMGLLIELLSGLLESNQTVDVDRVYATGISMGGYGTWDLISRKPEWFAAAMPVCGGGDVMQAAKLRDLPIFIYHGDADTAVPVWRSRAMIGALYKAGSLAARYVEYPGCGHNSWLPAYGTVGNLKSLFSQKRFAAKWQNADVAGEAGVAIPGAHYEVAFEFSTDGGKNWKGGMVRKGASHAIPLVKDVVAPAAPFSVKTLPNKQVRIVGSTKREVLFRNGKIRALP